MTGLARWCFRHRWVVVLLWVALLAGTTAAGRALGDRYADVFEMPGTESAKVLELMEEAFPERAGETDTVVWKAADVRAAPVRERIEPMLADVAELPGVGAVASPYEKAGAAQVSRDGEIAYASVTFTERADRLTKEQMERFVDTAQRADGDGVRVEVGGTAVQLTEEPPAHLSEIVGVAAAAVVLFLAFGSLFGMLLPIATALFAVGTGMSGIVLLSHVMDVAEVSPMLATLIGLGVGIDYALFIVTRYRRDLLAGAVPVDACATAVRTSGRAVLFAGGTVCIALLGMFALELKFLNGVAVAAALTVVITVAAAITLLPALLGILGPRVLSRRRRRRLAADGPEAVGKRGPAARWSEAVGRHPLLIALAAVAAMAALAVPALDLRLGASDQGNDPSSSTTRQAYDLLADGFGPGFNGPLTVLAEVPSPADRAALDRLVTRLEETPGVAAVHPGPPADPATVQVVPTTSPQAEATDDLVDRIRDDVIPPAESGTSMRAYVGGQTAMMKDFAAVITDKLPLFIGVIIALGFALLTLAFRSLLIPLTAAVMNVLAAAASFGVLVAVFQWGWGGLAERGPVEAFLPVIMLSLLFGLSMDYQVFLVSRMHEEWLRTRDNALAVRVGLAESSRVINSAAVIMICVFAAFVLSGERVMAMFGIGLAGAVALDAFVLRTALVPGLMHLLGRANWWPSRTAAAPEPEPVPVPRQFIRGTVRTTCGDPVAQARVTLLAANGTQAGRTAPDNYGSYTFRELDDGAYVVVALAAGHAPQTASVLLQGGAVQACDLRLTRHPTA
ncbi:MMPL family transporter [Streptomyces sp. A7024]|uniref:MMPL family transporter n=1 Tax=Streptomyces coryli TaxID=1128680 RepID=A0A6G4UA91_9ACTN|nr:MMPL family transporter [Streptomyces coryli]